MVKTKRFLGLFMAFVLCFGLCACGSKGNNSSDTASKVHHSVDVAKLAGEGKIPEVEFLVGDPVDGVKDVLFKMSTGKTYKEFTDEMKAQGYKPTGKEYDSYIITTNQNGRTVMSANDGEYSQIYCIFNTENEKGGIAAIAMKGNAYGFDGNTLKSYVKAAVDGKYKETEAQSDLGFLPKASEGATQLSYEFGMYRLEFYFSSYDTLSATVLYDKNLW